MRALTRPFHVLAMLTLLCAAPLAHAANIQKASDSNTAQRPLSDFLSAQGSTSLFIPPLPDFIGWTNNNPQTLFSSVDYAGVVASYLTSHGGPDLGTTITGSVSERPLADGRADVQVNLHVKNALTWVIALPAADVATDPLLYGVRGTDLLANPSLTPSLSKCEMRVDFTNTAPGAPMPDLVTAFILGNALPGQTLLAVMVNADGAGTLRAPSGFPEGTPGRFTLINNGVLHASGKGGTADGFPAEVVTIRPAGGAAVTTGLEISNAPTPAAAAPATRRTTWGRIKAMYQ